MASTKGTPVAFDDPVSVLGRLRTEDLRQLERLGIKTVRDLLFHFPRYYLDPATFKQIGDLVPGEDAIVAGRVVSCELKRFRGRKLLLVEARVSDGTGQLSAVFFNQQFMTRVLPVGTEVCLRGKVEMTGKGALFGPKIVQPLVDILSELPSTQETMDESKMAQKLSSQTVNSRVMVPVYAGTTSFPPIKVRKFVKRALDLNLPLSEPISEAIMSSQNLIPRNPALAQIHFPNDHRERTSARHRFLFEELFLLQVGLAIRRYHYENHVLGISHEVKGELADRFRDTLPFTLTGDQEAAISEIARDMERDKPMSRLLQGEVGSGKTIVAFAAMLYAVQSGHQAALMAPTEILAVQHFKKIYEVAEPLGVKVSLLTSSTPDDDRQMILHKAVHGKLDILIGTHALLQDRVEMKDLSLVIVDEQHRFGVRQRRVLKEKGREPDLLLMTATPIPRTVALTYYGDLETSTIRELPGGKSVFDNIKTYVLPDERRIEAYRTIRQEVARGHQAFIVCPLVEATDRTDLKAVMEEGERLKTEVFPDLRVGHIHGKMKPTVKDEIMRDFANAELDVLIASTVIEVGIDVPNATVIMIENADRFGLAQLHQLRGRVGRGSHPGICILFSDLRTEESRRRLRAMKELKDGFALADVDLEIRGEGQLFGTRQSGLPDLKLAKLSRDQDVLKAARQEAFSLINKDPMLEDEAHADLRKETGRLFGKEFEWLFHI